MQKFKCFEPEYPVSWEIHPILFEGNSPLFFINHVCKTGYSLRLMSVFKLWKSVVIRWESKVVAISISRQCF